MHCRRSRFSSRRVGALRRLGVQNHLQDGRNAMREGDLFLAPQLHQVFRVVAPRIVLLDLSIVATYGSPQACTWNIGVIGMYTSLVPNSRTLSMAPMMVDIPMVCSTSCRW